MPRALLVVLSGVLLALSASASAQMCAGSASYAHRSFKVAGAAEFNHNAKSFTGALGFGGTGAFGEVGIGTTSYTNINGSSTTFGGGAGYQVTLGQKGNVQLCPTAGVAFLSGPNNVDVFGDGSVVLDFRETDLSFALTLGVEAARSGQTQIIPTVSIAFVSATAKVHDRVSGNSQSNGQTFGTLGLGLGFVINQTVTLRPMVSIPVGLDGASTVFGGTISVNFGSSR